MRSLTPEEGLKILGELLWSGAVQIGVVPLNVRQWGAFHQVAAASPRLCGLRAREGSDETSEGDRALRKKLEASAPGKRGQLIAECLRGQVAQVLRTREESVELDTPLTSLGLDSLMGLELRNYIESALGIRLPVTVLWTYPTLAALAEHLDAALFPRLVDATSGSSLPRETTTPPTPEQSPQVEDDSALLAMLDDEIALARKQGG